MGPVTQIEELGLAVHGHGEFLPGQVGGADRGPGGQLARAHSAGPRPPRCGMRLGGQAPEAQFR
jgi:hypothetical protein